MATKLFQLSSVLITVVSLSSCATGPSDNFEFDFASAQISDFNGEWKGRVDCRYSNGFKPHTWVKISDGKGDFGFGPGPASFGALFGSLNSDINPENGKASWRGQLVPWHNGKKTPVSFRGYWRGDKFTLSGKLDQKLCSGVMNKV